MDVYAGIIDTMKEKMATTIKYNSAFRSVMAVFNSIEVYVTKKKLL